MEGKIFGKVLDITTSLIGTLNDKTISLSGSIKINLLSGIIFSRTIPIRGTIRKIDVPKKFVSVTPEYVFLTPSNFFLSDVDILSNTTWNIQ